ncbi:hypothetical protein Hanom_Chr06g00573371 [Helianthus anomalus]
MYIYILINNNNSSRANFCSCLARLQIEPNRAAHLQPNLKSNKHFSSNFRTSDKQRALWTALDPKQVKLILGLPN